MVTDEQGAMKSAEEDAKAVEAAKIWQRFIDYLDELSFDRRDLAHFLRNQGGYPKEANLEASIQRMIDGKAEVTAELYVIVHILVRQQRRLLARHANVRWKEDENGAWTAKVDDFTVKLKRF